MPSLFRFLTVIAVIGGVAMTGLYILATRFEPEQQTVSKTVPGVKVRR